MDWANVAEMAAVLAAFIGGQKGLQFILYKVNGNSNPQNSLSDDDKEFFRRTLHEVFHHHEDRVALLAANAAKSICDDLREALRDVRPSGS